MQDHLVDLYLWARGWPASEAGPHIIELGVRTGNSTAAFLAAVETNRRGALWSCDIAVPQVPPEWFRGDLNGDPVWNFMLGDCLSPEVLAWMPRGCHVLFVDVDPHSYQQTLDVCDAYCERLWRGGVALFHDTDPEDRSPVSEALREFCRLNPEFEWRNKAGCHGLGVMRRR